MPRQTTAKIQKCGFSFWQLESLASNTSETHSLQKTIFTKSLPVWKKKVTVHFSVKIPEDHQHFIDKKSETTVYPLNCTASM